MLRRLIADFREYPATMGFCTAWLLVFVAMAASRLGQEPPSSWYDLILMLRGGHRFGDMTVGELFRGQLWRPLTSTFVHYGILHFAMNAFGMYQLGALVESWYGSGPFIAIYVLIGAGGNVLSALVRRALGSDPAMHSGGGSTVLLGLVALCAVVGWRAKTRVGDYLRGQMVKILAFTALLGIALPIIDNWGHAGGALVGAAIGLAHRRLRDAAGGRAARRAGWVGAACLVAAFSAQLVADRIEAPARLLTACRERSLARDRALRALFQVAQLHRVAALPRTVGYGSFVPKQARNAYPAALGLLDAAAADLGRGPAAKEARQLRAWLDEARRRPPTVAEFNRFQRLIGRVIGEVLQERNAARRECLALQRKQGTTR